MSRTKQPKHDKYAKHKIAAIPILLLVLLGVLWPSSKKKSQVALKPQSPEVVQARPKPAPSPAKASPNPKPSPSNVLSWPSVDLDLLEKSNPLASFHLAESHDDKKSVLVSTEAEPEQEKASNALQEVAEELRQQTIPFAFHSSKRKVILLGDRLLTEGDEIRDHVHIKNIREERVVLEYRAESQVD